MVIKDLKCVFVHIPKTAGTSIQKILCRQLTRRVNLISKISDVNLFAGWNEEHKIWMQHATMQQINDIHKEDVSEYFKFAFVRNPYERVVSDWVFLRDDSNKRIERNTFLKYLNRDGHFKEMLTQAEDKTTRIDHTYSQYDFIYDKNGNCLVDFIGRFENLQEDFNIICDKIGIPKQQLSRTKKTKHKHYTEYYDEETKQLVAEKYAKDIEYFGYKFGE